MRYFSVVNLLNYEYIPHFQYMCWKAKVGLLINRINKTACVEELILARLKCYQLILPLASKNKINKINNVHVLTHRQSIALSMKLCFEIVGQIELIYFIKIVLDDTKCSIS